MTKKITAECAFCGKRTNYFFPELNCYICPSCLGEYKSALMKTKWFYYGGSSTYPYYWYDWDTTNEIKIDSVDCNYDQKPATKKKTAK